MKKAPEKPSKSIPPFGLIAIGFVTLAIAVFSFLHGRDSSTQPKTAAPIVSTPPAPEPAPVPASPASSASTQVNEHFEMPPYHENIAAVTLPPVKDPATVSPAASAAYLVVEKNPELIAQLPCFCYCNRFGHTSLHDCFVTDHAQTCDICMKEALQADQLQKQGLSSLEIRNVIIAEFRPGPHSH